jgi:hypothetical protein
VLEPRYNTTSWDAAGTFTPGVVKDCASQAATRSQSGCMFYLFFGGVANQDSSHTENIGVASSDSASAPFPSWNRSILTEIYLCHACYYHETEDGNGAPGLWPVRALCTQPRLLAERSKHRVVPRQLRAGQVSTAATLN